MVAESFNAHVGLGLILDANPTRRKHFGLFFGYAWVFDGLLSVPEYLADELTHAIRCAASGALVEPGRLGEVS